MTLRHLALAAMIGLLADPVGGDPPSPIKPIPRRIPPMGIELPADVTQRLTRRLVSLEDRLGRLADDAPARPDAAVYLKAVRFAIELREFYDIKDVAKADGALDEAARRIAAIEKGDSPWHGVRGKTIVLGHVSAIDGSVQPLGITVPAGLDLSKPVPLHIFLHGRGDRITDLHYIDRLRQGKCVWKSDKAIVLEPFGRQCIGWKGPGEVDVFEAIDRVKELFKIDDDRVALIGFSMGGAGAWHIGAHYADRFCIVCPGAGFSETAEYLRLKPEDYPNEVEQKLWGVNDTPAYVRNLFNTRVVAYSGELDRQKQAADRMARAYKEHGRELHHIIGPETKHKYHPESLKELHRLVDEAVVKGRDPKPDRVYLQTRTLRYSEMFNIRAIELKRHWDQARIDVEWTGRSEEPDVRQRKLVIRTKNVARFQIDPPESIDGVLVEINGVRIDIISEFAKPRSNAGFVWEVDQWRFMPIELGARGVRKRPGFQGPIDDAFNAPFLVVLPTGQSKHRRVQRWIEFESNRMINRWQALFRGDLPVKLDKDVTEEDVRQFHLVLWGDPDSNSLIAELRNTLPIEWDSEWLTIPRKRCRTQTHVPLLIAPNPANPKKYIVLNSGPTFREAHDRTNSLQNPKLGDWAIVDVTVDPTDEAPGRVVEHGFFDENWKLPARE